MKNRSKIKRPLMLFILTLLICSVPALALLITTVKAGDTNTIVTGGKTYKITADLAGGSFNGTPKPEFVQSGGKWIYNYSPTDKLIPVSRPIKSGCDFEGWLVDSNPTPQLNFSIPKWNTKDITITAKWKERESILLPGPQFNSKIKNMYRYSSMRRIVFEIGEPVGTVDVSEKQNGAIMGQLSNDTLYIRSRSTICANPDASYMFDTLSNMISVTFTDFSTNGTKTMNNMFNGCTALKSVDASCFDTSIVTTMENMFRDCQVMTSLNMTGFDTGDVRTMENMFMDCRALPNISVNHFDTRSVTTMRNMFYRCHVLRDFSVSNFRTPNLTDMANMFFECKQLYNMDLSNFDTDRVTQMQYLFGRCDKIKYLNFTGFDTAMVTDMTSMFEKTYALEELDISMFYTPRCRDFKNMFLSSNVRIISSDLLDADAATDVHSMFNKCYNLEHVDLDNFVIRNHCYLHSMFYQCHALTGRLIIATSSTPRLYDAFDGCSTYYGTSFVVDYTSYSARYVAQDMINTNNSIGNVRLGSMVSARNRMAIPTPSVQEKQENATEKQFTITLDNGVMALYKTDSRISTDGKIGDLGVPEINPNYSGRFEGYYYDKEFTIPVKPTDKVVDDVTVYAKW